MCNCGNTEVERTPNKSANKVDSGEENSPAAPAGDSNSQPFDNESGALNNKLSRLP